MPASPRACHTALPAARVVDLCLRQRPRRRSVSALLGVLGLVNAHALTLDDTSCATPAAGSSPSPTVPWSLCVRVLHQLELLIEMSAQRAFGSDGKWPVLAALESAKAAFRLTMLTRSGGCILVGDVAPGTTVRSPGCWVLPGDQGVRERAERTLRALAAFRSGRALSVAHVAPALGCSPAVVRPQVAALLEVHRRRQLLAGESLRVLRPVVYCLAASRWGRRSWKPWLASLVLDLARCGHDARRCCHALRADCSDAADYSDSLLSRAALTTEERAELQRRRTLLAYYVLFSPAYEVRFRVNSRLPAVSSPSPHSRQRCGRLCTRC